MHRHEPEVRHPLENETTVQVAGIEWSPVSCWQVERNDNTLTIWKYTPHTPCDREGQLPFGRVLACSLKNPMNYKAVLMRILNEMMLNKSVRTSAVVDLIIAIQNEFVKAITDASATTD